MELSTGALEWEMTQRATRGGTPTTTAIKASPQEPSPSEGFSPMCQGLHNYLSKVKALSRDCNRAREGSRGRISMWQVEQPCASRIPINNRHSFWRTTTEEQSRNCMVSFDSCPQQPPTPIQIRRALGFETGERAWRIWSGFEGICGRKEVLWNRRLNSSLTSTCGEWGRRIHSSQNSSRPWRGAEKADEALRGWAQRSGTTGKAGDGMARISTSTRCLSICLRRDTRRRRNRRPQVRMGTSLLTSLSTRRRRLTRISREPNIGATTSEGRE